MGAGDCPFSGEVLEVSANSQMAPAMKLLSDNNILSAPVYDEETEKYLGFFDLNDAMTMIFTLDMITSIIPEEWMDVSVQARLNRQKEEETIKIADIFEGSESAEPEMFEKRAEFLPVKEDTPIEDVIEILSKTARRVPVMGKNGRICKIISQSLITKSLEESLEKLEQGGSVPEIFSKSIKDIAELKPKPVFSIMASDTTREAFLKILENKVSGIAVLDEDRKLLTSISTKDIRMFKSMDEVIEQRVDSVTGDAKSVMDMVATEFVQNVRAKYESRGQSHAPAVSVTENCSLRKVIGKLAATKMHRIFVVDKDDFPVGVVSVSDIAKILVANK